MKLFFRALFILALIILCVGGAFSLYAHFLMDYSLDRLTFAVDATHGEDVASQVPSPLAQKVYHSLVQDLTIEEASNEKLDYQNLVLLDLATRSLKEVDDRAGYARAKVYLNRLIENKKPGRSQALLVMDAVTRRVMEFYQSSYAFAKYSVERIFDKGIVERVDLSEYSSSLLLNQAEEKEKLGKLVEAAEDYRKYLKAYPERKEAGFVAISLANILLRQRNYDEARNVLGGIQNGVNVTEENKLAQKLLHKIDFLREKENSIATLNQELKNEKDAKNKEVIQMKLALAYLATYQLAKAESFFIELADSKDEELSEKSKFYLGWIYKLEDKHEKSIEVFSDLLENTKIQKDFELGLRAQLADAYYQAGDVDNSLVQFKVLSDKVQRKEASLEVGRPAMVSWISFSELEQVNMLYFDKNDIRQAKDRLRSLGLATQGEDGFNFQDIEFKLEEASNVDLRDMAFRALLQKQIDSALSLFEKYLYRHPNDALTLTGLSTVYVLMGDLDTALDYARKAYHNEGGDYTVLMLGYILSLRGEYSEAVKRYKDVLDRSPDSVAGRFNLAYIYLRMKEYRTALKLLGDLEDSLGDGPGKKFVHSKTLNNMGYAYWGLGDRKKAEEYFRKSLTLTPDFAVAKKNLAMMNAGQVPESSKFFE